MKEQSLRRGSSKEGTEAHLHGPKIMRPTSEADLQVSQGGSCATTSPPQLGAT